MKSKTPSSKKLLGYLLRRASNLVTEAFEQRIEALGLTTGEWVVLREVHEAGGTVKPAVIAKNTSLTTGAVSKISARLRQKGYIQVAASKTDARSLDMSMTDAGARVLEAAYEVAADHDRRLASRLLDDDVDVDGLQESLRRIIGLYRDKVERNG